MKPVDVIDATCAFYQLEKIELCGDSRARHISWPRHTLMWMLRQRTDQSWREIGLLVGGRDARTAIDSVNLVSARRAQDEDFAARLKALERHVDTWRPANVSVQPALVRARRMISAGDGAANADAVACGIALLTVASIMSSRELTADEARRAVMTVLCGDAEEASVAPVARQMTHKPGGAHVQ